MAIPLHLAVHVLGLTVALALTATSRRSRGSDGWLGFALGGLMLAASYVVTGALIAPDHAWPVYLRAAGYAALAVGAAGRLVGAGAGVVVAAPMTAHVTAAVAAVMAALAAIRGIVGRGQATFLLGTGLALWAAADLLVRTHATGAASLSLAGSVAVGWWTLRQVRTSLLSRFVASFVGVLLVAVVALASAGGVVFVSDLQADQTATLEAAAEARVEQFTVEWPREMLATGGALAGASLANEISSAVSGEIADLDARSRTIAGRLPGIDVVVLVESGGRVVGSWDAGAQQGPLELADESVIAGDPVVTEVLRGATQAANVIALGERDILSVGAVVVAPTAGGEPRLDLRTGVLVLGRRVTDPRVVAGIDELTGADATILVGGSVAVSTLSRETSAALANLVSTSPSAGLSDVAGTSRFVAAEAVRGTDGQPFGTLVLSVEAGTLAAVEESFVRTAFVTTVVGLLVALVLASVVASRTARPVRRITDAAERVAGGDLGTRVSVDRPDEVGRLATAFNDMTGSLSERDAALRRAAAVEAELRGRLEAVTGSMGEALLAVDADGKVVTVNPAAATLLGRSPSRLVGRDIRRVLRGTDPAGTPLHEVLGGPEDDASRATRGVVGRGRDATSVAATAAPLLGDDGERLGRVYVLRDVTGEAEVERMKTEFLANISHELRTPLTPIKGYAEVMRSKALEPKRVAEFARAITESAERLERIVAMLVDFASLEAGRTEVNLAPTEVSTEVDEVLGRLRERYPERKLSRRIERDLPPVLADGALLRRVLDELLDNALKFSTDRVTVTARSIDDRHVRLTVRDRGSGIDAESLDVILRDFHQADGSATRRHGGLGLGLSIVQRIVDRFGGEVAVESAPDRGTDIHIILRAARSGS
ncbi:MAG: HAMP domain-containing protein [Actinobacteria bacterium]|nr:HAMP domain-containing protein [Actinomycetota bacterium]